MARAMGRQVSAVEKQTRHPPPQPYNLRKRKRNPNIDQEEKESLPKSKIPRRENRKKCLPIPILPAEVWTKIFGYLNSVTIHTKISLVCKYFLDMVRNSQNLAGEIRLSPKYLQDVFNLKEDVLSLLNFDLHFKMAEMLKRWPKITTVKFTQISAFEKYQWLRNRSTTNFERDIFSQFKNLKDFQNAWNTKTLKEVKLSSFVETSVLNIPGNADGQTKKSEGILVQGSQQTFSISVNRIQYDDAKTDYDSIKTPQALCKNINVSKYDAIRSIRMYAPSNETLKFMADRIKKLEHLEIEMGFQTEELLSKEWQKTFCDFLKSQGQTLTEITFLFPYCHYCFGFLMSITAHGQPREDVFGFTKFMYEAINKNCPKLNRITTDSRCQMKEFFPYPLVRAWKNIEIYQWPKKYLIHHPA